MKMMIEDTDTSLLMAIVRLQEIGMIFCFAKGFQGASI
jgi:hypothetical protein